MTRVLVEADGYVLSVDAEALEALRRDPDIRTTYEDYVAKTRKVTDLGFPEGFKLARGAPLAKLAKPKDDEDPFQIPSFR